MIPNYMIGVETVNDLCMKEHLWILNTACYHICRKSHFLIPERDKAILSRVLHYMGNVHIIVYCFKPL